MPKKSKPSALLPAPKAVGVFVRRSYVDDGRATRSGCVTVLGFKGFAHWQCVIEFDDGCRRAAILRGVNEPIAETVLAAFEKQPEHWRLLTT